MSELPVEQIVESGETQTLFLTNTYHLVDDSEVDDLISWNEDGTSFIIWKPAEFARDLLPRKLKHNDFSSFLQQLTTCGFRKVVSERLEFANDFFKRGEKELLRNIQGRKSSAANAYTAEEHVLLSSSAGGIKQVTDSATPEGSSKSTSPEMRNENRRLEKENQQMTDELSHLKGLCNNIFSMMSNYEPSGKQGPKNVSESNQLNLLESGKHPDEQGGSSASPMDDKEEDRSPMLFGVSIGAKRIKRNDDDDDDDESSHMSRQEQPNDAQNESCGYSNTARSEQKKKEPGPVMLIPMVDCCNAAGFEV